MVNEEDLFGIEPPQGGDIPIENHYFQTPETPEGLRKALEKAKGEYSYDINDPEASIKYDQGKLRYDLLPPSILQAYTEIATFGAGKYAPYNWTKGGPWGRYYAALMRHLMAHMSGEDLDPETKKPHLWHALWNLGALVHFQMHQIGGDDRLVNGRPR